MFSHQKDSNFKRRSIGSFQIYNYKKKYEPDRYYQDTQRTSHTYQSKKTSNASSECNLSAAVYDFDSLIQPYRQFCCKCRRSLSILKTIFIHHYRKFYCVVCFSQYTIFKTKQLSQYVQINAWTHIKFRYQIINCKHTRLQINQWISDWPIAEDFTLIRGLQMFGCTSFDQISNYFSEIGIKKSNKQIQDQFQNLKQYVTQNYNDYYEQEQNDALEGQEIIGNCNANSRIQTQNNANKWTQMSKTKKQMLKFFDFDQKRWEFQRNTGSGLDIYEIVLQQLDDIEQGLELQQLKQFNEVKTILLAEYVQKQDDFQNACRFLLETDFLQGKYQAKQYLTPQQSLDLQLLKQLFSDQISFSVPEIESRSYTNENLVGGKSLQAKTQDASLDFIDKQKQAYEPEKRIYKQLEQAQHLQEEFDWISVKKRNRQPCFKSKSYMN